MNTVVNKFDLEDFDVFLKDIRRLPSKRLAKKLTALLHPMSADLCDRAEIVQLKDGSFFLRWRNRHHEAKTTALWWPTLRLTRQQAFVLLAAFRGVWLTQEAEFAKECAALFEPLACE